MMAEWKNFKNLKILPQRAALFYLALCKEPNSVTGLAEKLDISIAAACNPMGEGKKSVMAYLLENELIEFDHKEKRFIFWRAINKEKFLKMYDESKAAFLAKEIEKLR